jgi:leucyl/phenylalanyl-tRNA---protein transferase
MFPPVDWADEDGLLAIGGDLEVETLRTAYRGGIFPWPVEGLPLLWFAPPQRAILRFDDFHVPRSLRKLLRRQPFEVRTNCNFEEVIRSCAARREYAEGTWITEEMIEGYLRLYRAGNAHSVETYLDGELVGGLYGVSFGGYFCGESMFFTASGASKAALVHLVEHLKKGGATWLDVQMMTPLFAAFGAREVPRAKFTAMLRHAFAQPPCFANST